MCFSGLSKVSNCNMKLQNGMLIGPLGIWWKWDGILILPLQLEETRRFFRGWIKKMIYFRLGKSRLFCSTTDGGWTL